MDEKKIKHLEFIQSIINRMNSNSFAIKGWAITIVSALLALYASSSKVTYVFVAIIPTIIFWCLDSYYLQQERKFRGLYSDVINSNPEIELFAMPIDLYQGGDYRYCKSLFSMTIVILYASIVLLLFLGGLALLYWDSIINLISNWYGKETSLL